MISVEQYIAAIESHLEKHSAALVATLQNVVSYTFHPAVELVEFTAHIYPTSFELSIMLFSMDNNANEVFGEDVTADNFAGSQEVLAETHYYELAEEEEDTFWDFYEENDMESKEYKAFTAWFARCWEAAGGATFPLPAYFAPHDVTETYDLQKKLFIEDGEQFAAV